MTGYRLIRFADCAEKPWKNGGGTTREIAVFPPGSSMDDFIWRLSMARVEISGAFSAFTGIDRLLAALEGSIELSGPAFHAKLVPSAPPFAFDGGAPVTGSPIGGPMLDCNAMARRGICEASLRHYSPGETISGIAPLSTPHSPVADAGEADIALPETIIIIALQPQSLAGHKLGRFDCLRARFKSFSGVAIPVSYTHL